MLFLAVVGGGGGTKLPPWGVALFVIVFVLVAIYVLSKLFTNRRK